MWGDGWGSNRSCHAHLAAREGRCRHQGPHKIAPELATFMGILGGGMTSLGANWGLPWPFFLLWGLSLWLSRYILGKVDDFFWKAWTPLVLQPLVLPVLFQAKSATP